jgi:hypothetical protein
MISDNLPSIIPQPRKAAPDLEVLRRVEILGQPALPAVPAREIAKLGHQVKMRKTPLITW